MRGGTVVAEARQRKDKSFAVAIDPRVAERRKQVAKKRSRPRRVLVIALAVVSLLAAAAWPLLHSRLFSARALRVLGAEHTGSAAVLAAAGLADHPPMIDVHAGAAAARIDALPWVRHASVSLHWPDGVVVRVVERRAVAVVADGSGQAEVDATGRVLAVVGSAPGGLVRLDGVGVPGAPGTTLERGRGALLVASALPVALRGLLSAVAPAPGGSVDLALSDGVGVLFGAPSQLSEKFEDVASLVVGARPAAGSVLDVSVPAFPSLTPPPTTNSSSSSSGAGTTPSSATG